jgi:hypothetical protein
MLHGELEQSLRWYIHGTSYNKPYFPYVMPTQATEYTTLKQISKTSNTVSCLILREVVNK